jgi:hypothetical protein
MPCTYASPKELIIIPPLILLIVRNPPQPSLETLVPSFQQSRLSDPLFLVFVCVRRRAWSLRKRHGAGSLWCLGRLGQTWGSWRWCFGAIFCGMVVTAGPGNGSFLYRCHRVLDRVIARPRSHCPRVQPHRLSPRQASWTFTIRRHRVPYFLVQCTTI